MALLQFLDQIRGRLVDDFMRVYRVLPPVLRRHTLRVFFYIVILACLEVLSILSISFLALSIASPEKLLEFSFIPKMFAFFPTLAALCGDPRFFALVASSSVVLLALAKNAMSAFTGLATSRLGEEISLFAGETVFKHYLYSPYIRHISGDSGAVYQALAWRGQLGGLVINIMMVYTYAVISLGLFLVMISATPEVLLFTIVCTAFIAASIYKSIKKAIDEAGMESAEFSRRETSATMNAMQGIREVLIYRQQPVFYEKFKEACLGGVPGRAFLSVASPIPSWILEVVGFMVIPVTLYMMLHFYDASMARITGVLTMIMLASWRILPILNRSLSCLVAVRGVRHSAMECLSRVEYVKANPVEASVEPDPNFVLSGDIVFQDVCFRYPGAAGDCLHDLNFAVECGKCTGIVGVSGAGKSTIVSILSGLLQPSSGAMPVGGRELSPAALVAYSLQVGYVPQSPYIMPGTLADNVAFSSWGRAYDPERVLHVCRLAALDVVESHPQGIRLPIGDKGAGLSGGQAQRLSIARALYANPALLILDEATSALDTATETAIMDTIYALPKSITTVVIAHRLSSVRRCDTLLWIDGGRLVESGSADIVLEHYGAFLEKRTKEKAGCNRSEGIRNE
ncbi:MAG: ABC transporter ATP-binding protein/permease [Desulfovibrio sp.]|jgi:ABC-type multidrug transport system fused ATPase/permease subunit|nr:ABC transporter ATP-binding protein/permease [Desulfovibrio sp.]